MIAHRGVLAPAFVAVYGGYNLFFGDIYSAEDLRFPDVLCARLAGTFVAGTQVGWFSLGGVTHGPNVDTKCGEMGEETLWMDPRHDPEVQFLKKVAAARARVREHLVHGRLGLPPARVGAAVPTFSAPSDGGPIRNPGPFPKLSVGVWLAANGSSAVLLMATPTLEAMRADYDLQAEQYLECDGYQLTEIVSNGSSTMRPLRRYPRGSTIPVRRLVSGRDVVVLQVTCVTS